MAAALGVSVSAVGSGTSLTTATRTSAAASSTFHVTAIADSVLNTPTDSKSNVYTAATTNTTQSTINCRTYRKENGTGGALHTWTISTTGSANLTALVGEAVGVATASVLDQANQGTDAATPFGNAIAITTTQAGEIIFASLSGNSAVTPATHAESTGFTICETVTTGGPDWPGALAYKVVASTGTYNASFTEASGTNASVHIVSYKDAGAAADTLMGQIIL